MTGSFQLDASYQHWTDLLEQHRPGLERAIRAVGRIETDNARVRTLLGGLPNEYVGNLPSGGGGPSERLLTMLHAMSDVGGRIGAHSAFYYVLKNAGQMRSWDTNWTQKVQGWLTMLKDREAKRT